MTDPITQQIPTPSQSPEIPPTRGSRRRRRGRRLTPGMIVLQVLMGVIIILGFLCAAQFAWQAGAMSLNIDSVSRELEKGVSTPITTGTKDTAAPAQQGDPPALPEPADDTLFAYLRIPRFGVDYRLPILEGTEQIVLDQMGAGHYPDSAMPGQVGNTSYAGHRYPGGFGYLDQMQVGDEIIIETGDFWYVYTVTRAPFIVDESNTDVVSPNAAGAERGLTLTTCDPMFATEAAEHRLIVHATFQSWMLKSDGVPASLAEDHVTTTERVKRVVETVSEQVDMPVCGTVAVCLLAMWLVSDLLAWMVSHQRMVDLWRLRPTANPVMLVWRLQAGVVPVRVVLMVVLCAALLFACWEWVCPWVADTIPIFDTPHPTV